MSKSPRMMKNKLDRVKLLAARVDVEYRWLHEFAHGGSSGILGERRGGLSRPTEGAALDPRLAHARKDLRTAELQVEIAVRALGAAVKTLRRHDDLNPRLGDDPGKSMITEVEMDAAREAKARREGRGEGWGAS